MAARSNNVLIAATAGAVTGFLFAGALFTLLPRKPAVKHIVCLRFLPGTEESVTRGVVEKFRAMAARVPGVLSFEGGRNSSSEGLSAPHGAPAASDAATHIFTLTFASEAAVREYLVHEAHVAFVAELLPLLAPEGRVFVADYTPGVF